MSKIMFFCIPAWGHTNPTLAVIKELVRRGHIVRYYSFDEFEEKIKAAGAEFVSCDKYLPKLSQKELSRIRKVSTTEMTISNLKTVATIDPIINRDVADFKPDCIVADSVCFWGKLFAIKHNIPFVSSTTTFAFNKHSSKYIQSSFAEMLDLILGMPRVNRELKKLKPLGYHVKSAMSLVQNDNDTNTIVYTSKMFQPFSETFSDNYVFVGPSVPKTEKIIKDESIKTVYISLGTVINQNREFYKNCIEALKNSGVNVIISVGKDTDVSTLGTLPENIKVYPRVNQMEVLSRADAFLTHCGMNSVSESLYMGVPLIMFPSTGEQKAVAKRTYELGAGVFLGNTEPQTIYDSIMTVLNDASYTQNADKIREDFLSCPGPCGAADFIESIFGI